ALLAGQVHLLAQTNLDNPTARVIEGSPGTTIARVENAQWYTIPMLYTSEEFADSRVREAMRLAYDPAAVLDTALQGTGAPGWDNPVPPQQGGPRHRPARDRGARLGQPRSPAARGVPRIRA